MCRQNHGIGVDYFAVGVMAFECMFGRVTPSIFIFNRDPMLENPDRRSETIFYPNKFKLKKVTFPRVGLSKQPTSSTKYPLTFIMRIDDTEKTNEPVGCKRA